MIRAMWRDIVYVHSTQVRPPVIDIIYLIGSFLNSKIYTDVPPQNRRYFTKGYILHIVHRDLYTDG